MKLIQAYLEGMRLMGPVTHQAIVDEIHEFIQEPSVEEFFDVFHGVLRLSRIDLLGLLAWPTARKHALRVIEYGCPRSRRNHNKKGESCVCKN